MGTDLLDEIAGDVVQLGCRERSDCKGYETRRSQRSSTGPEGFKLKFGLRNIPRGHTPHDHFAMQGWSEGCLSLAQTRSADRIEGCLSLEARRKISAPTEYFAY